MKLLVKVPYSRMVISGKRLVLRPYKLSDLKKVQESHAARLPSTGEYDMPLFNNPEKFKERVLRHRANAKAQVEFVFGIFGKKDGRHIGEIGFLTLNKQIRWANIGYHIQNQFFGQGYASEAGELALGYAFRVLNYHRVEAGTELGNKASQKVALKIGMRFEGKRLKFFPDHGGVDMNFYGTNALDFGK